MYVHVYTKLLNFIQLSLSLTKLFHLNRDPSNFYISLEKEEITVISLQQYDLAFSLHKFFCHDDKERVRQVYTC